jgi:hypothetical protein
MYAKKKQEQHFEALGVSALEGSERWSWWRYWRKYASVASTAQRHGKNTSPVLRTQSSHNSSLKDPEHCHESYPGEFVAEM